MSARFYENAQRSIVKAITFRVIIIFSDTIVVFLLTHRYDLTAGVVIFTNLTSTILYIFHERLWNSIHWGKFHKKK